MTTSSEKYTAVIVEPRKHAALELVLRNFYRNLGPQWNFMIFHGNRNRDYILNILERMQVDAKRFHLFDIQRANLTWHEYNALMYSKTFYEAIPTEIFLIFQTDTVICDMHKDFMDIFLQYDYVGAPWKIGGGVGNGGLSLRRKSKMLEKLEKCDVKRYQEIHNEDVFFATIDNDVVPMCIPDYEAAKLFAIETVFSDKSFGIHKCWNYMSKEEMERIHAFCPDLKELMRLQ